MLLATLPMMLRPVLVLGSTLVVLLVACGGSVSGGGSSSGASGSSGPSGNGGTSSTGGLSGTSGAVASCTVQTLAGDRACVPGTGRANTPITIAVDASKGCLGCFTTFDPCNVTVTGDRITVSMVTRTCPPAGEVGCPAVCTFQATTCTIPPLAAGTYKVDVVGDGPHGGLPDRELVVTADGATSCKLPSPPNEPKPIPDSYPRECATDDDCAIATIGSVCAPCTCPNTAIAKSALPAYEADYRAATSQCPPSDAQVKCGGCENHKAICANRAPGDGPGVCVQSQL